MRVNISCLEDLKHIGIHYLTGEACGYAMRGLCSLTRLGVDVVCDVYGIKPEGLRDSWNAQAGGEPALASIMLPTDMQQLRALIVGGAFVAGFARVGLLRQSPLHAIDGVYPIDMKKLCTHDPRYGEDCGVYVATREPYDATDDRYTELVPCTLNGATYDDYRYFKQVWHSPSARRNTHRMSGRVE